MTFLQKTRLLQTLLISLFVIFVFWWTVFVFLNGATSENLLWGNTYQIIALLGAVGGIIISNNLLYGMKSSGLVQRSILYFSIGLLLQVFGQSVFGAYILLYKVNAPYPSLADVGFFTSAIFYICALVSLAGITGVKIKMRSFWQRTEAFLIPLAVLALSYFVFLQGYHAEWDHPIKIFLDFAYPLVEATYVSLALIILLFAKDLVGGAVKWPPLLLAMIMQYLADFNFLYQVKNGTWTNYGYGDILYLLAYFILSISLTGLGITYQKLIENNKSFTKDLIAEE